MRVINFTGVTTINNNPYSIPFQFFNDDIISARKDMSYSVDFTQRPEVSVTIQGARQWIRNQLVTLDPFIVGLRYAYIGDDPNSIMLNILSGFDVSYDKLMTSGNQPTSAQIAGRTVALRNQVPSIISTNNGQIQLQDYGRMSYFSALNANGNNNEIITCNVRFVMTPTAAIRGSGFSETESPFYNIDITTVGFNDYGTYKIQQITLSVSDELPAPYMARTTIYGDMIGITYEEIDASVSGFSGNDPYEITPSTWGGGYGSGILNPSDLIPDPEAPNIDAITTGLLTVFKPTLTQIQNLGDYLWSSAFDVDTLKKLFADPMQAIIGLAIVPINPPAAGSKSVKIGDVDTGITMPYISRQFVEKDLGSISIDPFIGSFMDYAPYTKIDIYLPYIGFRSLDPADIMGTTLHIKYIIDVITGGCNAIINVSGKGAIYQFNGSCIANVPLSAINYSGAIQNAVSAVGNGITTVAGIATGNAPIGLMGVAGLASNAANTAVNSKPTIQRSGAMGGAAGLCSVQFPYAVIERPRLSTPESYNSFVGNTLNVTMPLGNCHGLTIVDNIHLDNVICTDDERNELMSLLHEGVIL